MSKKVKTAQTAPKKRQKIYEKAGRPKAVIDWDAVGAMLEAGATAESIAASIGVERSSFYKRCEKDNNCTFSVFSQQKRAKGDIVLATAQFKTAVEENNVTMQIWLGKQRLGQTDKTKNELTGRDGGPLAMTLSITNAIDEIYGNPPDTGIDTGIDNDDSNSEPSGD